MKVRRVVRIEAVEPRDDESDRGERDERCKVRTGSRNSERDAPGDQRDQRSNGDYRRTGGVVAVLWADREPARRNRHLVQRARGQDGKND